MKLTKVEIGENRYFHKFERNSDGAIITVVTTKTVYDNLTITSPTQSGYTWVSSCIKIGFNTLSKELSDGQYATQANGAQWVKIPNYPMTKLPPGYITNGNLSKAGEDLIAKLNQNE